MRKTVVDGSNTSGFQRTSLIATDGTLETDEGTVGVDVVCLEEDSARKLDTVSTTNGQQVIYNLDRLGLPLIEIATSPDVVSPDHAKSTAMALGRVLRQTRRVRRGLGSIRQDLNVSIGAGDRVEIKGCQDLNWIPRIIRLEMARQLHFYRRPTTCGPCFLCLFFHRIETLTIPRLNIRWLKRSKHIFRCRFRMSRTSFPPRIQQGGRWLGQRGRRAGAPAEGFAWEIGSQIFGR